MTNTGINVEILHPTGVTEQFTVREFTTCQQLPEFTCWPVDRLHDVRRYYKLLATSRA